MDVGPREGVIGQGGESGRRDGERPLHPHASLLDAMPERAFLASAEQGKAAHIVNMLRYPSMGGFTWHCNGAVSIDPGGYIRYENGRDRIVICRASQVYFSAYLKSHHVILLILPGGYWHAGLTFLNKPDSPSQRSGCISRQEYENGLLTPVYRTNVHMPVFLVGSNQPTHSMSSLASLFCSPQ